MVRIGVEIIQRPNENPGTWSNYEWNAEEIAENMAEMRDEVRE